MKLITIIQNFFSLSKDDLEIIFFGAGGILIVIGLLGHILLFGFPDSYIKMAFMGLVIMFLSMLSSRYL